MNQFILPAQIAAGILFSVVAGILAYQFGLWIDRIRANWDYWHRSKQKDDKSRFVRIEQQLDNIIALLRKQ